MDIHVKIASALHIACGALVLLVTAVVALFMGGFAALANIEPHLVTLATTIGGIVVSMFVVLGLAQVVAGIYCLQGSNAAKVWLIVFSLLGLFNIPVGTLIGGYSLWAFLRTVPVPPSAPSAPNA